MVSCGARKAALLLMSLDSGSAAELLKNAPQTVVSDIAVEIAHIEAAGQGSKAERVEPAKEFFTLLHGRNAKQAGSSRLPGLLKKAVGSDQADEIFRQAQAAVRQRDPFLEIRSAEVEDLARMLKGESGQVAAMVLSEMKPAKAGQLMPLLDERVRAEAVRGMTSGEGASPAVQVRVAQQLLERMHAKDETATVSPEHSQKLRKVAMLLRGLDAPTREAMLKAIDSNDAEAGKGVRDLMVVWEDVATVADRSLQNILRLIDAKNMALAMHEAAPAVAAKINGNISERARALVEEEMSLMSAPKAEEVTQARNEVLKAMRELNASGQLEFEEQA